MTKETTKQEVSQIKRKSASKSKNRGVLATPRIAGAEIGRVNMGPFSEDVTKMATLGSIGPLAGLFDAFLNVFEALTAFGCQPRVFNDKTASDLIDAETERFFEMADIIATAVAKMPKVREFDRESRTELLTRWAFKSGNNADGAMVALASAAATATIKQARI